jgi:predicted  nucleic acid-binding Zn-ribbon protein
MDMSHRWFAAVALLGAALAAPAHAQTLASAQQELSAALVDAEGNLTTGEAIEMNMKDWKSRFDSYKAQFDDLNSRIEQANSFCQGTYEHDEYERRVAQCNALFSQLDGIKAQLEPERVNLSEEADKLQKRAADNDQAMQAIQSRLTDGLQHLTFACAMLSANEFATKCRVPPAPGPRTAPMVERMNGGIAGQKP